MVKLRMYSISLINPYFSYIRRRRGKPSRHDVKWRNYLCALHFLILSFLDLFTWLYLEWSNLYRVITRNLVSGCSLIFFRQIQPVTWTVLSLCRGARETYWNLCSISSIFLREAFISANAINCSVSISPSILHPTLPLQSSRS